MSRLAPVLAAAALAACRTPAPPGATAPPPIELQPAAAPRPPDAELLVACARALRAEGDLAGARERLEEALEAWPADPGVRVELADLLVSESRDLPRAEALLAGVVPPAPGLHLVRARLAEAKGDDAAAASEYARALEESDDVEVRLRRALALDRLGDAAATEELERVRAARPDDAVARSRLAGRYEASARLAEAEAEYRWLAESQPDRASEWERLARFYARSGRPEEARSASARARAVAGGKERTLRPLPKSRR